MERIFKYGIILIGIALLSSCRTPRRMRIAEHAQVIVSQGPTTVFVHGTLFPFIDTLVRAFDLPRGLYRAVGIKRSFLHGRIAKILNRQDPQQFPYDTFYYFGWSGALRFDSRFRAAHELYQSIKHLPHPITLIGHSHGGNVILALAEVVDTLGDKDFYIDRAVLLATPMQVVTSGNADHPMFKEVYTFYSEGDTVQISDPQGLYRITRRRGCGPILSERLLPDFPHVKQARVRQCMKNPAHLDFIRYRFLTRLPRMLDMMESSDQSCMVFNLPKDGYPPEFVEK